jgi:hypothetical protein
LQQQRASECVPINAWKMAGFFPHFAKKRRIKWPLFDDIKQGGRFLLLILIASIIYLFFNRFGATFHQIAEKNSV